MNVQLIWGQVQRPWGYEVRVDFIDNGKIYNEQLLFPSIPTQQELDAAIAVKQNFVEEMTAPPPTTEPQYTITNEDGTTTII